VVRMAGREDEKKEGMQDGKKRDRKRCVGRR